MGSKRSLNNNVCFLFTARKLMKTRNDWKTMEATKESSDDKMNKVYCHKQCLSTTNFFSTGKYQIQNTEYYYSTLLTLKAQITTAADNILFFLNFFTENKS